MTMIAIFPPRAPRHLPFLFCLFLGLCLAPHTTSGQVIDTAAVRREVDSLVRVCRGLTNEGQFEEALRVIEVAEGKAERGSGKESGVYAKCIHNKGIIFYFMGKYDESETFYLESRDIRGKVFGKEHPDYAASLNNLALLYREKGDYIKAESLYLEAKEIRGNALGKSHPDYARSLNNLAILYADMGDYAKAELLHLQVKEIREKALGKEHPEYAQSLYSLAVLYLDKSDYVKAEPLFLKAKEIREKVLGKRHPDYARSLHYLAILYLDKSDYTKAEPLFLEAKEIREKSLGKKHPEYAGSLNSLAILYSDKGDYAKAEPLFLEAKEIREKTLGKEHPDYAASLNNLAVFYKNRGDYPKAESLHLEAKEIRRRILGKERPEYAQSLENLAILYCNKGDYAKAEPLFLEAKEIREKVLGKEHLEYARSLNNLAGLYRDKGDYTKAALITLEAKEIKGKTLGKGHPEYAESLNNLATLYVDKGDYAKAEHLFLEAKEINGKTLGKEHPNYADNLNGLAVLYRIKGEYIKATMSFLEEQSVFCTLIKKSAAYSSEREILQYAALFKDYTQAFLSLTQDHPTDSLRMAAYDNALFQNNALLEAAAARERAISNADSATQAIHSEWKSCLFRLNKQYALPIADRDSALVALLEENAKTYEKALVRRSPAFVESRKVVTWQQVRDALQPNERAIEFISYRYHAPQRATDSIFYAALVLRPGDTAPAFVPLCEQKQLEALLGKIPVTTDRIVLEKYYRDLYRHWRKDQSNLYELLWKPLEAYLQPSPSNKTDNTMPIVYFSPDGLLHRLNLGAIQDPNKTDMGQRCHLVQLGSTRRLAMPAKADVAGNNIALFGGIQYELDSTNIAAATTKVPNTDAGMRSGTSFFYADSTQRSKAWRPLPWTQVEVKAIETRCQKRGFRTQNHIGTAATEEALKSLGTGDTPSPRVLHLATHGFFFPDPKTDPRRDTWLGGEKTFRLSDDPMRRAGLLLAGANHAWRAGKPFRPNMEDGILTAAEIKNMNLANTELVVLSACETGLGEAIGNEGVYGLQRAFKIAGAKYLLMSLWSVDDRATQAFMDAFYAAWLDKGLDIPAAFRAAQASMKTPQVSPFDWAGFVLVE